MEIQDEVRYTIKALLQRPIAFNRAFAQITGSVSAGLLLSQLYFWSDKGKDPDWIYKTNDEIEAETTMTRREQDTARRLIKASGVCEVVLKGLPAKLHYRINLEALHKAIAGLAESAKAVCTKAPDQFGGTSQTSLAESAKLDWRKAPNIPYRSEITSENTTETTQRESSPAAARRSRIVRTLPDAFCLSEAAREFFIERNPHGNADREFEKFVAYHQARGSTMADWDAAWRTWAMNSARYLVAGGQSNGTAPNFGNTGMANLARHHLNARGK